MIRNRRARPRTAKNPSAKGIIGMNKMRQKRSSRMSDKMEDFKISLWLIIQDDERMQRTVM